MAHPLNTVRLLPLTQDFDLGSTWGAALAAFSTAGEAPVQVVYSHRRGFVAKETTRVHIECIRASRVPSSNLTHWSSPFVGIILLSTCVMLV